MANPLTALLNLLRRLFGGGAKSAAAAPSSNYEDMLAEAKLAEQRTSHEVAELTQEQERLQEALKNARDSGEPAQVVERLQFQAEESRRDLESANTRVRRMRDNVAMLAETVRRIREARAGKVPLSPVQVAELEVLARQQYADILERREAMEHMLRQREVLREVHRDEEPRHTAAGAEDTGEQDAEEANRESEETEGERPPQETE